MKRVFFAVASLLVMFMSICVYANAVTSDLENNIIRLHILARSDSDYDQAVKLAVRDDVLSAISGIPITDTKKFQKAAETAANEYLTKNNIPYRARAEYGSFIFPRKTYNNITLPAGRYNGVRIILDRGDGQNWWCVMYPPLCVSDKEDSARAFLKSSLSDDSYELITKKPEVRFKILELLSQII